MPIFSSLFKQLTRSVDIPSTSVRLPTSELSTILLTKPLDNQGESYSRLLDRGILATFEAPNLAKYGDADGRISIPITDNYNSFLSGILPNLDFGSFIKPISNNDSTQFLSEYRSQQTVLFDLYKPAEEVIQVEVTGSMGDDQNNIFTESSFFIQSYDGRGGIDTFSTSQLDSYYTISTGLIFPYEIMLRHFDPIKTIRLENIERIKFSNSNLAFDLYGNAGMVAKIYGAVLGKDSLLDSDLIGDGLDAVDSGMSYENFATITLQSTGIQTNAEIVRTLWTNVVGSAPTADQEQPFISKLDSGEQSVGELVMFAAGTSLNQENINLIGLTSSGIEYA